MSRFKVSQKRFNDLLLDSMVTLEFKIDVRTGTLNPRIIVTEPHDNKVLARIHLSDLINPMSNFYLMKVRVGRKEDGWENEKAAKRHRHSVPCSFPNLSELAQKALDERIEVKSEELKELKDFHSIFGVATLFG